MSDPRAAALAAYLRRQAATFSLSADVNDAQTTAEAGMSLLDAARLAEQIPENNAWLERLSRARRFETMPDRQAMFLETAAVRSAIQRSLTGHMSGAEVLDLVLATAVEA